MITNEERSIAYKCEGHGIGQFTRHEQPFHIFQFYRRFARGGELEFVFIFQKAL